MTHSLRTRLAVLGGSAALLVTGAVPVAAEAAAAPQKSHYQQARAEWRQGAKASDAERGRYLRRAKLDLKAAPGDKYHAQRYELYQIYSTPNTGLTPAQIHRVRHATRELNRFFHTPGLYF